MKKELTNTKIERNVEKKELNRVAHFSNKNFQMLAEQINAFLASSNANVSMHVKAIKYMVNHISRMEETQYMASIIYVLEV